MGTYLILSVAVNIALVASDIATNQTSNLCLTPGCIQAASNILSNMDASVEPCDDFYQFACGKFIKQEMNGTSSVKLTEDLVDKQLRVALEENVTTQEPRPFRLLKKVYQACMNTTAIERDGLTTIKSILLELGGWPVLKGQMWDQERFDWKQSVYRFRNFGYEYNYFFVVKPWIEIEYYSQRTLCIEPAHVTRPSDLKSYLNKMVNVATALGAERRVAEKELNETLNFELNLSMMASEPREDTNRFISISELQQKVPSIPWLEYLNSVLNLPHVTFPAPALMLLRVAPSYFSDLETLLFNTPKRIQANYLMWKVVESSIPFLTEEVQLDKSPFRWKKCVSLTSKSMPIVTGALYVRKHFNEGTKQDVMEMVSNIRKQFANTIKTADWMDDDTKQHALDKVAAMSSLVAYPDEFLSDEIFKDIYEGLHVMSDNFLKIILSITLYDYQDAAKRLVLPVKQPDWFEFGNVVNVNGHYVRQSNIIKLPAAILQGVFFSTDRPRYMNYGGIGFIIGHEITHGFDNTGRLYDKFGSLKDWWAPSANTKFIRKAQCLIDQYGNVSVPEFGLNLNGSLTQPENIADNGGVRNAYLAYNEWVRRNGKEPLLPNLNYTDRQLFWISAANAFCEKVLPRKELIQISRYPPTNFRINVALSNTDYFAKDFNCRIGSEMNPFKKCAVWKFLYI